MSAAGLDSSVGVAGALQTPRRGLSLRWRLILLVVVSILPLLAFSLGDQYLEYRKAVATTSQRTLELARSMALLVDEEMQGFIAAMETLAVSRALQEGDLAAFRAKAEAVVAQQFPGANILLLREDGQQMVNTILPLGEPLPKRPLRESTRQVFATGHPGVSNLFIGSAQPRPIVAITVPVRNSDGTIPYVVQLNPNLDTFTEVIRRQQLPASWLAGVFDRSGVSVARIPNGEQFVGREASPNFLGPLQAAREGFVKNRSREGIPLVSAFSHAERFGWAVAIGVPRAELIGPALSAAMRTLAVGVGLLAIGLILALYAARRIGGPIGSLRRLAAASDGTPIAPALTGLPEVDEVALALHNAEEEQRASREAERILRDAVDTMPEGFVIYDDRGRLVLCNRSYREFYPENVDDLVPGVTFEEILRAGIGRGRFPDAIGREEEWIAERLRRQLEPQEPIEQKLADGRWAFMTKHRLTNGWVVGLRIDITSLKTAEQALQTSEERFRRVVEAVANAIIMIGADGTIEMVNAQAEAIFGYKREDLLGQPVETLLPERYHSAHPGLRNAFFTDPQARLMGAGRDLNAVRKDGSEFPVEIGLSPLETADGPKVLASIINITQRRQAQRMQAYFAAIVESSADAIIAKDLNGVVSSWNKAAELIFGYSAEEMVGEPISRLLPSDRLDEEDAILDTIRRGERIEQLETVRRRKNGSEFPVSLTISPIFGLPGEIVGASKIVRNISDRLESEQELRRERDAAQRYLDVADVMILVLNLDATVKVINARGCEILGYDAPDEIVGKSWIDHFLPSRIRGTLRDAFGQLIAGELANVEHHTNFVVTRTGEERLIAWHNAVLRDGDGTIIATVSSGEDITERKRMEEDLRASEDRFRSIFSAVSEGIFIVSPGAGIFMQVNETGCLMFGYTPDELIGADIEKLSSGVAPYTQHNAAEWIEKAAKSGRTQRFEWHCRAKDGRLFWTEISIRFASISGESVILATVRDITERQTVEAQLRQAQKMEAIGNLTGGMAHDFNNLLGVIVGNLGLVQEQLGKDEDLGEMVGEALDAAWRGADLTRRLLAFARRQPLRPMRVDINELVSDTVRLLRRLLGEDIEVSLNLGPELWPVTVDPAQLESAIANLANNARDAMARGGRLIIATANRQLDADYAAIHAEVTPGDFVMIEVSDTGAGMSPEVMSQIFEPFFTTKEQGKGTGLGLSMVFGFLRQSGGHINVYSEPGVGTTFRLYLPRATAEDIAADVAETVTVQQGAGETVLVVEDNAAMRRVSTRQLRDLGYRVLECDRAAAALDILQRERVDLLFTDIVMPGGLDGVELARLAQERWPTLKIVLTSGFPQARLNGDKELGNLQLLSKPYHREELAAALQAALRE
jgi:PAS domain S-box-containing protein